MLFTGFGKVLYKSVLISEILVSEIHVMQGVGVVLSRNCIIIISATK